MKYSALLRELINISGLQIKEIAQGINYDISYISKWINDKNIPSAKQSCEVNNNLAKLFTTTIYENNLEERLRPLIGVQFLLNSELIVHMVIATLLRDAYFTSLEGTDNDLPLSDKTTILGADQVLIASRKIMSSVCLKPEEQTEVYTNLSVKVMFYLYQKTYGLLFATHKSPLRKSWAITETPEDVENLPPELFYMLMSQSSFYDTIMYRNDAYFSGTFIYIKNKILVFYVLDNAGLPFSMTVYTDKSMMKEMDKIISNTFRQEQLILAVSNDKEVELEIYRRSLYQGNHFMIFLAFDNGLFISEDLLKRIQVRNNITPKNREIQMNLLRIQKDLIKKYSIEMAINPKSYSEAVSRKQINLGNQVFALNEEEYCEYIKKISEHPSGEYTDNLCMYVVRNDLFPYRLWDSNLTYVASKEFVYLKKDITKLDKHLSQYFYTMDLPLIKAITGFMDKLKSKSYFDKLTLEQAGNMLSSIYNFDSCTDD